MIARWDYYVAPVVCAAIGAFLGGRGRTSRSAAVCAMFTVAAAIAELAWHESSRIDVAREPRLVVAMTLALAIPAFLAFAASVLAVRSRWTARNRALVAVATAVPAVALYPLYGLYLVCYVGHDCI